MPTRLPSLLLVFLAGLSTALAGLGLSQSLLVEAGSGDEGFDLVDAQAAAPLHCDAQEWPGVVRAALDLQGDIERVTGRRPDLLAPSARAPRCVLIGTLGRSPSIDALVRAGKLDVSGLTGKWESFLITTVEHPLPGVESALVVAGSDKRGSIYGLYELSEQMGVSPWHWWADVPPAQRGTLRVRPGAFASGEPRVRYRGIFLNNEAPCLTGWANEKFGGLNAAFYGRVFELLLRLRANYLWPAMWDNAFNEDDPENPRLADEYGIVMGTSHHEPMMRAHKEWTKRRASYGNGRWDYASNAPALQRFFREGIARNARFENLVTIGLRGDGDESMVSAGSLERDLALLRQIFSDQRRILSEELRRDPAEVPQLWALFTEVQRFYEAGLRPPDDVTLLWTDDNVGSLRRLPTEEERRRSGGAGIYYHFDMHGGPYSYQWINTNPLPRIAEQMSLAADYGATRIWIVNVGDLKPHELPIEFFLRLAWDPLRWRGEGVARFTEEWARRDFGPEHAAEIASLVSLYAKYNGWRKPELLSPATFSQLNHSEAARVEAAWTSLVARAEALQKQLPERRHAAFHQLVLHPAKASALVARMNVLAGRNQLYARQGRAAANRVAEDVRSLFEEDGRLADYYNQELSGGKWNHLMDQTHLGQWSWEPPVADMMPAVSIIRVPKGRRLGVALEGDPNSWPAHFGAAVLPALENLNPRRTYVDVFALGSEPVASTLSSEQPWVRIEENALDDGDRRYWISVDWKQAPEGFSTALLQVSGEGTRVRISLPLHKAGALQRQEAAGCFASLCGPVSIAANNAVRRTPVKGVSWQSLPDYGRVQEALTVHPSTAASVLPPEPAATLEYPVYLPRAGTYEVTLVVGPVQNFVPGRGVRVGVAFDEQPVQVVDLCPDADHAFLGRVWSDRTSKDNAGHVVSRHLLQSAGAHRLRLVMVDPGVVLQKIIIHDRKLPESYFGPPEMEPVQPLDL